VWQAHSYLAYPSFFAVKCSFLQDDPLVSLVLPAMSSRIVVCHTGLVLWYRSAEVDIGVAAGQTVMHCHCHVIPRCVGDEPEPRGGVRGVVPGQKVLVMKNFEGRSPLLLSQKGSRVTTNFFSNAIAIIGKFFCKVR